MRHDLADKLLRAFFFDPRDGVLHDSAQRGQKATADAGVTILSPFGLDLPRTTGVWVNVDNDRGMPFEYQSDGSDTAFSVFTHFRYEGSESATDQYTLTNNQNGIGNIVYGSTTVTSVIEDGKDHTILLTCSRGDGLHVYLDGEEIDNDTTFAISGVMNVHYIRYRADTNSIEINIGNQTNAGLRVDLEIGGSTQNTADVWSGPIYANLYWHHKLNAVDARWLHYNYRKLRESLSVRRPRFAFTDVPADVRLLTAPKPWTKQPPVGTPIDWGNPLTKGLTFAWSGAQPTVEVTQGDRDAGDTPFVARTGPQGRGAEVNSTKVTTNPHFSGKAYRKTVDEIVTNEQFSMFALGQRNTDTTVGEDLIRVIHNSNNAHFLFIANNEFYSIGSTFGSSNNISQIQADWIGGGAVDHSASYSYKNGSQRFFEDGRFENSNTVTPTQWNARTTDNEIVIGCGSDTAAAYFGGHMYCAYIWSRYLTDAEHAQLAANPWQIFKPQNLQVPIEYEELTFDETKEEKLFMIPPHKGRTYQP